jgi:hypothetical protein
MLIPNMIFLLDKSEALVEKIVNYGQNTLQKSRIG